MLSPGCCDRWAQSTVCHEGCTHFFQSEYTLSSAFPVKWPFLEPRLLPSGGIITLVKWSSSSSCQVLAVGAGCHYAENLSPQGFDQKSLWKSLPRATRRCQIVTELCIKPQLHTLLLVPHDGQGEADRREVGLLLPAGAGTWGCSWPCSCGWKASLCPRVWSQVIVHLGSSSFPSRILLALLLLSTKFFWASQSGCACHLAQWQPPLQLRQVLTKSKGGQRSSVIPLL